MDFILFIVFLYVFGILAITLGKEVCPRKNIYYKGDFRNENYKGIN